jgi:hypothetical protein
MMTLTERAAAYVANMPSAISGQGGHQATFAVASALIHGFALYEEQAWPIMCEYNARCQPPWSEAELRHKLADAAKLTRHPKLRGHLSGITHRDAVGISIPQLFKVKLAPLVEPGSRSPKFEEEEIAPPRPAVAEDSAPRADRPDEAEAKRIAGELVKAHKDGAISGPDDPELPLDAEAIHLFGGTYIPKRSDKKEAPPAHTCRPRSS